MLTTSHGASASIIYFVYTKFIERSNKIEVKNIFFIFLLGILLDIPLIILVLFGKFSSEKHYHHKWITHTPIFWLCISLIIAIFYSIKKALWLLVSTWLHLGMDWYGGGDGIAFLYPFNIKQYGLLLSGLNGKPAQVKYLSNIYFFYNYLFSIFETK